MSIVNVLGYGVMGKQIIALLYLGGFEVNIWNQVPMNESELTRQIMLISRSIAASAQGKISYHYNLSDLPEAITIEAVIEDLEIKQNLYRQISKRLKSAYFTNSSSFAPSEIGRDVNALHFFNPITLGLVELYLSQEQIEQQIQPILDMLKNFKFEIVRIFSHRGYIGNYLLFREIANFLKLVEKYNYPVETALKVYAKLYENRNIISIIDLVGIDVSYKILVNLKEEDDTVYLPECLKAALEKNILGRKNKTSVRQVLP